MTSLRLIVACSAIAIWISPGFAQGGSTPANAQPIGSVPIEGEVRGVSYFSYEAAGDGVMNVVLQPVAGGEVDLTVVHFSGSPAAESRQAGSSTERIALVVNSGDRFLIRVSSPLGVSARYVLSISHGAMMMTAPAKELFVPQTSRSGRVISDAIELPLQKVVPIEAEGDRFFKFRVPEGFLLEVTLYTVAGDLDLHGWVDAEAGRVEAISNRSTPMPEMIYLPLNNLAETGEVVVRIDAMERPGQTAPARYGLVARLRHAGVTPERVTPNDDEQSVRAAFSSQGMGTGLPGGFGASGMARRVLSLP